MLFRHCADDGALAAQRVSAHGGEHGRGRLGRNDGDELAFVGHIERVEAEQFAGAADHFADGDGGLVEFHTDFSQGCDFIDGAERPPRVGSRMQRMAGEASSMSRTKVCKAAESLSMGASKPMSWRSERMVIP